MRAKSLPVVVLCFISGFAVGQSAELFGIAHVAFRVGDLQKARQFYERLGFEQAFDFTDEHGVVTQAFIKINDGQFVELYPRTPESQTLGLTHVCYEARNIQSLRWFYVKAGLDPPEAKKARAGNLLFVLHDPEGRLVEFTQYMPGSLHSEDRGKHLGAHRISEHILAASLPVTDLAAERSFYVGLLALILPSPKEPATFRVGGDELRLEAAESGTGGKITLETIDEKRTRQDLSHRSLNPKNGNALEIADPDGNVIAFESRTGANR